MDNYNCYSKNVIKPLIIKPVHNSNVIFRVPTIYWYSRSLQHEQ